VSSVLLLTETQNATLAIWFEAKCFEESNFSITKCYIRKAAIIFDRCLEAANIAKVKDQNALFKAFISCAQYYLNKHNKGHVRRKIRAAATRKYLLKRI
jgi:hypothetical protein